MEKKADLTGSEPAGNGEEPAFKVEDRRHWTSDDDVEADVETAPAVPSVVDGYRREAEEAQQKLQEYIEAFKKFRDEQDQFRQRLNRDVDRRVSLKFGTLVAELLDALDNLDLALGHAAGVAGAESLAHGVTLARDGFLGALERAGVEPITPDGAPFDPNEAEAMRVDPVDSSDRDGVVTETLRPGYRMGEAVIRPARVAVGRFVEPES
jgi:molecular chaperone GrpE